MNFVTRFIVLIERSHIRGALSGVLASGGSALFQRAGTKALTVTP